MHMACTCAIYINGAIFLPVRSLLNVDTTLSGSHLLVRFMETNISHHAD